MRLVTLRFLFGTVILLLVDILWVASSEITEYLYHEKQFNKPFFTAYAKSVMFVIYLFGFVFLDSWWISYKSFFGRIPEYYSSIGDSDQQNLTLEDEEDEDEEDENCSSTNEPSEEISYDTPNHTSDVSINCDLNEVEPVKASSSFIEPSAFISDSIWVPLKYCSDTSSLSGKSETEDDESVSGEAATITIENFSNLGDRSTDVATVTDPKMLLISNSNVNYKKNKRNSKKSKKANLSDKTKSKRSVRFSKLIEVRQLTDKHAEDAFLSRLSYSAFMRVLYHRNQQGLNNEINGHTRQVLNSPEYVYKGPKLGIKDTALLAFYFTTIWFAANLSFHMGLQYSEAGLVNVLSSTTPLFTLLLGIIFPSGSVTDSLSLTKLLGVLVCISSVAIVSNSHPINHSHPNQIMQMTSAKMELLNENIMPLGSIWSLCGAFFYSVYIVLMRYNVTHDSILNFPMFFGFIGLFSMILMWPIILLLNFTQLEVFEWPSKDQWLLILVNGLCGTVISELLWLWGSFMTSSLVGTIAVSFTIPLAVFFDIYFKDIEYSRLFFLGTIPMFFSFVTIIFVSQYENWDPIMALLEKCVRFIRDSLNGLTFNDVNSNDNNINGEDNRSDSTIENIENNENLNSVTSSDNTAANSTNSQDFSESRNSKFYHRFLPSSSSGAPSSVNEYLSSSSITNYNRRFDGGKNYRSLKKDPTSNSSSLSSRHFSFNQNLEDEYQEQCQALIEAEDNAYV